SLMPPYLWVVQFLFRGRNEILRFGRSIPITRDCKRLIQVISPRAVGNSTSPMPTHRSTPRLTLPKATFSSRDRGQTQLNHIILRRSDLIRTMREPITISAYWPCRRNVGI